MCKKLHIFSVVLCSFFVGFPAHANECVSYKIKPKIIIKIPEYTYDVIQPRQTMNLLHGNVVATLVNNYDIIADITSVDGGYCVGLKTVEATIGYNDFLVKIDKRHKLHSCSFNAILAHENMHIDAYLSVIDDYKTELYNSLYSAADSVMPIFVEKQSELNNAVEELNDELQSHPDIILMIQKIHAAEEIKNKKIDQDEDYSALKKCLK